jgi:hypothetical protein
MEGKKAYNRFRMDDNQYIETSASKEQVQGAIDFIKEYSDYHYEMLTDVLKAVGEWAIIVYLGEMDSVDW